MAEGCGHTVSATAMVSLRDFRREVTSVRTACSEGGGNGDMVPVVLKRRDLVGRLVGLSTLKREQASNIEVIN